MKITKARLKEIIMEEIKFSVQSEPEEEYDDFDFESYDAEENMEDDETLEEGWPDLM